MELSFRSRRILYAVVTEYISTGEPVGSRRLSKRYGINLSPASIRNVLADLEEGGYLKQPHPSSGRIPTDNGFRVFVDALVHMRQVSAMDRAEIAKRFAKLTPQDDVMRETGRLLSTLTGAAAVVASPRPDEERLAQLRFIDLSETQLLAVLVSQSGAVQNRVLDVPSTPRPKLERLNNYLASLVAGKSLLDVRNALAHEVADQRDEYDELRRQAQEMINATVSPSNEPRPVVIEGQGRLFDRPEFLDAEKMRRFLGALEEKGHWLELLDGTIAAGGVRVVIGSEANLANVNDVSLISSTYRKSGAESGTLGVIGPARMDYGKVVPLVAYTAQAMSHVLDGGADQSGGDSDSDSGDA